MVPMTLVAELDRIARLAEARTGFGRAAEPRHHPNGLNLV